MKRKTKFTNAKYVIIFKLLISNKKDGIIRDPIWDSIVKGEIKPNSSFNLKTLSVFCIILCKFGRLDVAKNGIKY